MNDTVVMTSGPTPRVWTRSLIAFAIASVTGAGCGGEAAPVQPEVSASGAPQLLATVSTNNGRVVRFMELAAGQVLVESTGVMGQPPIFQGQGRVPSLAALYKTIQPNSAAPASLVEADARVIAARSASSQLTPATRPPDPVSPPVQGPRFYNAGEEAWFRQTFCDPHAGWWQANCQALPFSSYVYIAGPWEFSTHFEMEGMVESESPSAAYVELTQSVCSSSSSCSEQVVYWRLTPPGNYTEWIFIGGDGTRRAVMIPTAYYSGPFMFDEYAYTCFDGC